MGNATDPPHFLDIQIARRLKMLRGESGWTLEELAAKSGVSRATLSRLENGEVSPTTSALARLCAAYGLTMSRLMYLVEENFPAFVPRHAQPAWTDKTTGFRRRSVSPPAQALAGEALECEIPPDTRLAYDHVPRPGLEHHLFLIEGRLDVTVGDTRHSLGPGDCLRYQLAGPSAFRTPPDAGAHYLLFMV